MSSDMLREVSDSLFESLIETFPPNRPYSRSDIEQDPMPPLLAHFLSQTLHYKLDVEVEHLRTVRSKWFDYDHADVQSAHQAFVASLARHMRIPAEEWRATLKRSTKLVFAHLILPTHTLAEYVFQDEDAPLPAPVIYRQLSFFAAYPYLKEAIETFMKQRQLKEIDRSRFSSLLVQIDKHMTANYSSVDWLRLLRPMFDLMKRVPYTNKQGVPIDLLVMFFGDKDAYEIQERLSVEKELHRSELIDPSTLQKVIEGSVEPYIQHVDSQQDEPEKKPAPPGASQQSSEPAGNDGEDTVVMPRPQPAPASRPKEGASNEPRPLWEQFQETPNPAGPPKSPNGAPAAKPVEEPKGPVPLWMQFQKGSPKPAPGNVPVDKKQQPAEQQKPARPRTAAAPSPSAAPPGGGPPKAPGPVRPDPPSGTAVSDQTSSSEGDTKPPQSRPMTLEQLEFAVLGLYGSSNRDMFVEHLFSGSRDEYLRLLHRLKETNTWQEASGLIAQDIFKKHNVNIYSPAAIMFTESVEEQYKI